MHPALPVDELSHADLLCVYARRNKNLNESKISSPTIALQSRPSLSFQAAVTAPANFGYCPMDGDLRCPSGLTRERSLLVTQCARVEDDWKPRREAWVRKINHKLAMGCFCVSICARLSCQAVTPVRPMPVRFSRTCPPAGAGPLLIERDGCRAKARTFCRQSRQNVEADAVRDAKTHVKRFSHGAKSANPMEIEAGAMRLDATASIDFASGTWQFFSNHRWGNA